MRPLRSLVGLTVFAGARLWRWLVGLVTLALGRVLRARAARRGAERGGEPGAERGGRIVPAGAPQPGAEIAVVALLCLSALFAAGFIVVYAVYSSTHVPNELLGVCMGGSLACIAAALALFAKRLVISEEVEEPYPQEHAQEQHEIVQIVHESASRITRRRLLAGAGAAAAGALGLSALTPALSLGPLWYTDPLYETPWRRGLRLVDKDGRPYRALDVQEGSFYTAFPEGASQSERLGAPLVVVRLQPSALRLPAARAAWAPEGILAYSKICTHAGCAVALYRKPTFPTLEPRPALVCPCHYSTFDPARAGAVIYGPAGRPLPQLPLTVDRTGYLRAAGNFSGPVGPSWWGVRSGSARTGPAR